ncbi:MAG: hypothetical protein JNM88_06660 [Chitinophagaceae bacterium]|nr:hypothetical protein [Chitinophagaceae bacterium]
MRKLTLLAATLLFCILAVGQAGQINQINIVNFTVKNTLPASVESWMTTPGALMMTAQKVPGTQVREPMMVLQIRSGSAIICGNTMATAKRIDPFDVRVFTTADLLGLLGNCKELKPGNYTICVQFFNIDKVAISREVCRDFRVEDAVVDYSPPTLITPDNGKKFTVAELQRPVQFRWTPLVPKPRDPVTYRLRVWQLMQGQNGVAAMRSNTPIADKEVKEITQATVTGLLTGPCRPPYLCDFIWNVQALNREGKPMGRNNGTSEPYTFSATETTNTPPAGAINPPKNQLPEANKRLLLDEAKGVVKFEWLPVSQKQTEPVTYKLKVWQLMQGQTGTAAMKNNKPLVERSVTDATQANVSGLLTGPCRPPYLCDFIWNVQAVNREGKPLGGNNGSSEPTMFFVTQYIIQLDSIKVLCTNTPGVYSFSFTLTNVNPGTANLTNFAITSSTPAGATFGPYAPPIGTGISTGNQLTITGTINAAPNLSNICIGAEITDAANSFWKASKDTCIKVEPCRCDACDEKNFIMNTPKPAQINWANYALTFTQPVTITTTPPKTIKNIFAELVYYEMIPQVPDCIPCNKDASLYGHFANGTNSQQWSGPQSSLNISITTPNVPCCSTVFRWCIRYKVEFTDCTVCSKVICYEKKKEGCVATGTGTEPSDPKLPK